MNPRGVLYGKSGFARGVRAALRPLSMLYGGAVSIRNQLYDSGLLRSHTADLPVVSVGNISVGGTGKTPVCAWLAERFLSGGVRPGIVLRGYGGDEQLVHRHINPAIPVVADADRLRGIRTAIAAGATVAILDDAFQHRRIKRGSDIVLVSAERWNERMDLIPAGDLREPLRSLSRASLIVITRKSASRDKALAVEKAIRLRFRRQPVAIAHIAARALRNREGSELPLTVLQGKSVLAFSGVGDNEAFQAQLSEPGIALRFESFGDHHDFSDRDIRSLVQKSRSAELVVCTLKDAVKLWNRWPADARPLWYVSQALVLESGGEALDELIGKIIAEQSN